MPQCWAHNQTKVRCELDAGHDGLHTVYITWDDADCYEPSAEPTAPALPTPAMPITVSEVPPPPPADPNDVRCVACQHKHRGRECPGSCECKEFIG